MEKFGFPGTIGCIDGTHVALIRPVEHEETFFNRKSYHSLNVLIVSIIIPFNELHRCLNIHIIYTNIIIILVS